MPLLPANWVPGITRNESVPGFHSTTSPVGSPLSRCTLVLPGRCGTVAIMVPSEKAATEFAATRLDDACEPALGYALLASGMGTQPVHVKEGSAPRTSTANTWMLSRRPWLTT